MMKNRFPIIPVVLFLTVLLFSSCITNKEKLYLQGNQKVSRIVPFQPYRLSVNDEITYYLMTASQGTQYLYNGGGNQWNTAQNNILLRIYEDGCISLPTIGRVKIAGMTIREAEKAITEAFKSIVLDAEVKIALTNNYFYVEGDGGKGRFYVYKEDLTIFQALAMAGDVSSIGDKQHIKIIRQGTDGMDQVTTLDLRKESIIGTEYYYIRPNDVIYIPTNSKSFFRIESVSGFVSMVVAPLSLVLAALTYFK